MRVKLLFPSIFLLLSAYLLINWTPRKASCRRNELRTGKVEKSRIIGAYRCQSCHRAEYQKWLKSRHARAYESLPLRFRSDSSCLGCHSLGREPHLWGVQCESCHGGGRYYSLPEVMVDSELARAAGLRSGKKRCISCHRLPYSTKKFSYREFWKKIAH